MSVELQVASATDVSVATVVDAIPLADGEVEYHFQVLERLAGFDRIGFTVVGRSGERYGQDTTFDSHTDPAFWTRGGGRVMNDTDCVIYPGFIVGDSYLVFLGAPFTRRSFEKIDVINGKIDHGDRWLAYVKAALRKPLPGIGSSQVTASTDQPSADSEPNYRRVGRFIYAFHRSGISREELTRIEVARAPPGLAERARRLADEFDLIVKSNARVSDEKLDAALREGAELGVALRAWRNSLGPG